MTVGEPVVDRSSAPTPQLAVRRGPEHWGRSWALLLRWQLMNLRLFVPVLVLTQTLVGVGAVLAITLWFDLVPPGAGLFVTTGGATLTLVMLGVVALPQLIAEQRLVGTYDYQWSLPIPRSASIAAALTINLIVAVPALVATLIAGVIAYDLDLAMSPSLVPAVLLTASTAGLLGAALAHGTPNPKLVAIATQVLIFVIFGFTPILYPEANLPGWLASLHDWFPFASMATVVRDGMTDGLVDRVGRAYGVMVVWLVASAVVTARAVGRRG